MEEEIIEHGNRALSTLLMAGSQMATRIIGARHEALREARQQSEQQARQMQTRLDAQRRADLSALRVVEKPEWWRQATTEQVAEKYELAQKWRHEVPDAQTAHQTIGREVLERYGVDIHALNVNRAEVLATTERIANERAEMSRLSAQATVDRAQAQLLLAEASAYDALAVDQRAQAEELGRHIDWDAGDDRSVAVFERAEKMAGAADGISVRADELRDQAAQSIQQAEWRENQAGLLLGRSGAAEQRLFSVTGQRPADVLQTVATEQDALAATTAAAAAELGEKLKSPTPDLPYDTARQQERTQNAAAAAERKAATARTRAGSPADAAVTRKEADEITQRADAWSSPDRIGQLKESMVDRKIDPDLIQTRLLAERSRKTPPDAAVRVSGKPAPKARKATGRKQNQQQQLRK